MKIKKVIQATVFHIVTDEPEYDEYTRHSATSWTKTMGESDEVVYDCKKIEKKFQKWLNKNTITMKKLYTEKDLVKFGNFLLSEERKGNTSKKNRKLVTDADLGNWKGEKK